MKIASKLANLKALLIFLFLFFLTFFNVHAQELNTQIKDSTVIEDISININDIPSETERLSQRITKLKEILKPSAKISDVDSLLVITSLEVNAKSDSLYKKLNEFSRRELKGKKTIWNNYHYLLKEYQDILKNRTDDLSEINDEIVHEIAKFNKTKEKLISSGSSNDVYKGLDQIILSLQDVLEVIHSRLDAIFTVQNRLTEVVLMIDEVISEINIVESQIQKNYFVIDNPSIWHSEIKGTFKKDSTKITNTINVRESVSKNLRKSKEQIIEFIILNKITFILQIVFILSLFIIMLLVNKIWKNELVEISNPIEIQSKTVLSHPIASSIIAGVLISTFFYDSIIPPLVEIYILLILIGTFFLLPKLTNRRFNVFLALIFLTYFIQIFQAYIGVVGKAIRWLMIFNAIILIIAFIYGKKTIKKSPNHFRHIYRVFNLTAPIYMFFLIISIIANVIGMTALSRLLAIGVLSSTLIGIVVYLTVKVITSLIVILFKLRISSNIETITTIVNATHKRIQPILLWIGFFVWLNFTIKGFDLYNLLSSKLNELMALKWEIGESVISLGGILAFLGIFVITILIAKLIANILQDDWMINMLPRGLASAISLLLRIIIVSIGFYIAITAAGIDLSKLGFIIGALGVGIGFGLQNVVLNFISGLILAFERPINIGDSIKVDQEFGVVTNIGVRSSTIKSYSGYESIIPNADLISKKVNNYTLSNRDRRSKIYMKTAPNVEPNEIIELFNQIASNHPNVFEDPLPKTYFYGYDPDGNLSFALMYWSTFSDTLKTDSALALEIFATLKEKGIQAPTPIRRIINES